MKYLKTLALLITLSTLTSCEQGFEDLSAEVYSMEDTQDANGTKADEPNDSTATSPVTIIIDEAPIEDIDIFVDL